MASEGSREIDAAKQRLALAKAQASGSSTNMECAKVVMESAKAMMETAKKNIENAQSQLERSSKEVTEAEKLLEEAEERWGVIDIDQEPDSPKKKSNYKRRKVSPSPQESNSEASDTSRASVGATARQSNSNTNRDAVEQSSNNGERAGNLTSHTADVNEMLVEGCGIAEVNGTFKRVIGALRHSAPVYSKKGNWVGKTVDFVMCREYSVSCRFLYWSIGIWYLDGDLSIGHDGEPGLELYTSSNDASCITYPGNGWVVRDGVGPAPKCQPNINNENGATGIMGTGTAASSVGTGDENNMIENITVEGCGLSEVNGIYKRSDEQNDSPVYQKEGQPKGEDAIFEISHSEASKCWFIRVWHYKNMYIPLSRDSRLYQGPATPGNSLLPPKIGWRKYSGDSYAGISPVPKLKW
mmetsp:Transcript_17191/g.37096  ORF Transcript_17191/g.37096 Transcript_17191/m.37096 type:complete len:411 (-) Transcript_17191:162-1394(-)